MLNSIIRKLSMFESVRFLLSDEFLEVVYASVPAAVEKFKNRELDEWARESEEQASILDSMYGRLSEIDDQINSFNDRIEEKDLQIRMLSNEAEYLRGEVEDKS